MTAIVCIDASGGMLFGGRRQSQDSKVTERIAGLCQGRRLWMHPYSYPLYGKLSGVWTQAAEDFLSRAGAKDVCLVEMGLLAPFLPNIEEIIVFCWNRRYPADVFLDVDVTAWKKVAEREFSGTSHERITERVYR